MPNEGYSHLYFVGNLPCEQKIANLPYGHTEATCKEHAQSVKYESDPV